MTRQMRLRCFSVQFIYAHFPFKIYQATIPLFCLIFYNILQSLLYVELPRRPSSELCCMFGNRFGNWSRSTSSFVNVCVTINARSRSHASPPLREAQGYALFLSKCNRSLLVCQVEIFSPYYPFHQYRGTIFIGVQFLLGPIGTSGFELNG